MNAPATIRGYAARFSTRFQPDGPTAMLVKPGAFQLDRPIALWVDHDQRNACGSTLDHMRVWQDSFGLAFEIDVANAELERLAGQVANGRRDAVSVTYASGRTSHFETIDGERVEIVAKTRIDEISLLPNGACPGATAWLSVGGADRAPWELLDTAVRWNVGRQKNMLAPHQRSTDRRNPPPSPAKSASEAEASPGTPFARGRPLVPASVVTVLALANRATCREAEESARAWRGVPASVQKVLAMRAVLGNRQISGHATAGIFPEVAMQLLRLRQKEHLPSASIGVVRRRVPV